MNEKNTCNIASTDPRTKRSRHKQKAREGMQKKKRNYKLKRRKIRG